MSVISVKFFKTLKNKGTPAPNVGSLTSASSQALEVTETRLLTVRYNDRQTTLPIMVVSNLNEMAIAGMDIINALGICYDPRVQSFISAISEPQPENKVFSTADIYLKPFEAKPIRVKLANWTSTDTIAAINIATSDHPGLFANQGVTTVFDNDKAVYLVKNCSGAEIRIPRGYPLGEAEPISQINAIKKEDFLRGTINFPKPLPEDRRKKFLESININVPDHEQEAYEELLLKNHDIFSKTPSDLGKATNFKHSIQLKEFDPVYRKQFRIPEHHSEALQKQVGEWLSMGIIEPCHSRYNSSIFAVPKKGGKIRFVLDYRGLNDASTDDRYSMKDIHECIGDIGKAESTIFSTMDLTSGFWQLPLDQSSRQYTAFTVPGMGQYQYKVLAMGLKGGPGSFQRMMELTCKGLDKVIVYIDDLIVHTRSHDEHRQNLQRLFHRLRTYKLKLNLAKCFFGSKNVTYLGYRLTPDGILPGTDKLQDIRNAKPPTSLSEVRAFLGLCNFFRSHVHRFAALASPLIKLTTKEAGWRGPHLPEEARQSFLALRDALVSEPIVKYPKSSLPYELYCDASTGGVDFNGGYGAILAQRTPRGEVHVIAYASRALKKAEANYTPYLAEMMCAVWAMNHFCVELKGRKFTLFTDHKPLEKLSTTHTKTFNRLQEAMLEFDFETKYYPGTGMPADFLSRKNSSKISAIAALDFPTNDILNAQAADPLCQEINRFLNTGVLPDENGRATLIKRISPVIVKNKGVLFRSHVDPITDLETTLLILPRALIDEAVHRAHGTLLTGHGGIEKTKRRLLSCYYWPNMQQDIKEALLACPKCQLTKTAKTSKEILHPLPQCSAPNQRLHMDLFGPLKTPSRSKAYIMCMTDAFTKYVEVATLNDKSAETVSQIVFDSWICRFGLPSEIVTDGGKEFCNKISADLYEKLRISHSITSPAHPQCNALAEVANKHFQKYLSRMCENNTLHWEHLIPPMAFAYNTSVHSTTGVSPAFLLFGYNPSLPGLIPPSLEESENNNRLQALQRARDAAHANSTRMALTYKSAHDKGAAPLNLAPGQQVLVDVRMFKNGNKKLSERWEGPYFVYKVHPKGVVDILKENKLHRVNVDRIKPYIAPPPGFPYRGHDNDDVDNPESEAEDASGPEFSFPVPGMYDDSPPTPIVERNVTAPRGRGRPRKEDEPPKKVGPYEGPTTRSRVQSRPNVQTTQSLVNNPSEQISVEPIMVSQDFKRGLANPTVRQTHSIYAYRNLLELKPQLRGKIAAPPKEIKIYYGDNNKSRDEFGIPVTKETMNHPEYLKRRQYFEGLDTRTRNKILTGDPDFAYDPVFYEYVLMRPKRLGNIEILGHLFDQGDQPPGPPGPPRPDSPRTPPNPCSPDRSSGPPPPPSHGRPPSPPSTPPHLNPVVKLPRLNLIPVEHPQAQPVPPHLNPVVRLPRLNLIPAGGANQYVIPQADGQMSRDQSVMDTTSPPVSEKSFTSDDRFSPSPPHSIVSGSDTLFSNSTHSQSLSSDDESMSSPDSTGTRSYADVVKQKTPPPSPPPSPPHTPVYSRNKRPAPSIVSHVRKKYLPSPRKTPLPPVPVVTTPIPQVPIKREDSDSSMRTTSSSRSTASRCPTCNETIGSTCPTCVSDSSSVVSSETLTSETSHYPSDTSSTTTYRSKSDSYTLSSSNDSDMSTGTVKPRKSPYPDPLKELPMHDPLEDLRARNRYLDLLEEELERTRTTPLYEEIRAHPIKTEFKDEPVDVPQQFDPIPFVPKFEVKPEPVWVPAPIKREPVVHDIPVPVKLEPVPNDQVRAHPVGPSEQEGTVELRPTSMFPKCHDPSPPSFMSPEQAVNVTPNWGQTTGLNHFPGRGVFNSKPIEPVVPPDLTKFKQYVSPDIQAQRDLNFQINFSQIENRAQLFLNRLYHLLYLLDQRDFHLQWCIRPWATFRSANPDSAGQTLLRQNQRSRRS